MNRCRIASICLIVLAAVAVSVPLTAQTASDSSAGLREGKPITQVQPGVPFAVGGKSAEPGKAVAFRSAHQMTAADRRLLAGAESSIAKGAGFASLQLNEGRWSYRQIVCAALPHHLFLRFMRNNGADDRSVFSVSIPRNGRGRVRVIPILRRSYSLFSPAPVSSLMIDAFNQIRREEGAGRGSDWLDTALCYAALAGANPRVGPLTGAGIRSLSTPPMAEMQVPLKGGAIVRFTDEAARPHPTLWTMTFNSRGRLLNVKRSPAPRDAEAAIPPASTKLKGKLVPSASQEPIAFKPIEVKTSRPSARRIPLEKRLLNTIVKPKRSFP